MIDREKRVNTWSLTWIVLQLAVVFSVFSQITPISNVARPAMYAMWGVVIAVGCIKHKGKIPTKPFTNRFFLIYVAYLLLCFIAGLFDKQHLSSNYIRVLIVPLLVTVAGDMNTKEDKELFNRLAKLYLITAVIFALWVQITYIPSYSSWLSTRMYLFKSKNSAGQIWVSAIFLTVIFMEFRTKVQKYLCYIACIYLLIMTGICQCRTALLSVAVAVVAYAVYKSKNKVRWIMALIVFAVVLYVVPLTHQFIEQALFLNKYAGADLNTFSSGRIVHWQDAIKSFAASPIIGVGEYYVDNSYLLILAESGLVGFFLIEWVWLKKISICYSRSKFAVEKERTLFFFMATFYIVESVLEGYPPFGPGVSSFMFWFLSSAFC